ncbi:MAG: GGDEF domain-containing protein [Yoonia sp.]|uniref:GGDEF domain-containing protein n=1 Tax=Yoonia sp. TaxID=2212373 RepID=UPI003EF374B7
MANRQAEPVGSRQDGRTFHIPLGMLSDLVKATSRAEILDWMSRWSSHVLDARHSVIALAHDEDALLVTSFFGPTISGANVVVPLKGSFLGSAHVNRKTNIQMNVAQTNHPMRDKFVAGGISTLIVTPILTQGRCFGSFGVGLGPEFTKLDQVIPFLETLAACLANQLLIIEQVTQLDRLTRIDPLTNSFNRRHLAECASDIWITWQETGKYFAIVSLDLDHFKKINDGYGHEAGDVVLKIVAQRIRESIRSSEVLIRMGGEEFCILITAATRAKVHSIGERVWQTIRQSPVSSSTYSIPVTASVGFAIVDKADQSYHDVLRRADAGLYQAKTMGRDQVRAYDPQAA